VKPSRDTVANNNNNNSNNNKDKMKTLNKINKNQSVNEIQQPESRQQSRNRRTVDIKSDPKLQSVLRKRNKKPKRRNPFMACLYSIGLINPAIRLTNKFAQEAAEALELKQKHLNKLRKRFNAIDLDGSGNISVEEFLESLDSNRTPFTDRLFQLIDLDGNGTIEFDEYVRVLATYCMFSKDEILRFCFECYDVDQSGAIDEKEFVQLCKTINNGAPSFPSNFKRALEDFDVNEDGLIDYTEFIEIERRFPLILFPAFKLQDTMQKTSLGEREWVRIRENVTYLRKLNEYRANHGGRNPPEPFSKRVIKLVFPCFFRSQNVQISIKAVGSQMEANHRSKQLKRLNREVNGPD